MCLCPGRRTVSAAFFEFSVFVFFHPVFGLQASVCASVSCCQYRAALVRTLPYTQFKPFFFFITGCKQRDDDDDDDDFCFVFWGIMWNLILESFTENKIFYILKKL